VSQSVKESVDVRVGQVLAIVREVLSSNDIAADDEVMDHGGTSLSIVRILVMASRDLGLNINPRDLNGVVTARSLALAAQ
jgi:acyl carrier protein